MSSLDDPKARPGSCPRLVGGKGRLGAHACGRKATVEHDGKSYCRQHAPKRAEDDLTPIYVVDGAPPRVHVAYGVLTDKQWTTSTRTSMAFGCVTRIFRADVHTTVEDAIEAWRARQRLKLADALDRVAELRLLAYTEIDPTPVPDRGRTKGS